MNMEGRKENQAFWSGSIHLHLGSDTEARSQPSSLQSYLSTLQTYVPFPQMWAQK